jgi:hypothetical protein
MNAQPGWVEIAGSMTGPWQEWPLQPESLRAALRKAGAPDTALKLHTDGGWLTIEPGHEFMPTDSFGSVAPAEALAAALQELHALMPKASEEWASTLRLTEFHEQHKVEALVGLTATGIQAVGRQSPWLAVPEAGIGDWVRKYWLVAILLAIALGGTLYMNWDQILEDWRNPNGAPAQPAEDSGAEPASS